MSAGNEYATDMQRLIAVMQKDGYEVLDIEARYEGNAPGYQAEVDGKTKGWYYGFERVVVTFIDHLDEPLGFNGRESLQVYFEGSLFGYNLAMYEAIGFRGIEHEAKEYSKTNPVPARLKDAVLLYPNEWAATRWGYKVPA